MKAKMIKSFPKSDREKLASFERLIHRNFTGISVAIEPFMLFSKGEDEYEGTRFTLDRAQTSKYTIHPPDMILYINGKMLVFELDGDWHINHKSKDEKRDERLRLNNIDFIIIDESELRDKLGLSDNTKLTFEQLDEEFEFRIKEFIKDN